MNRPILILVLLALAAPAASAHDLFLKPSAFRTHAGATVSVEVMNGSYLASENAVSPDRIAALVVSGPGGARPAATDGWTAEEPTSRFPLPLPAPGTWTVGLSTKTRLIELSAEDFNDYLDHDGIPDVLEARRRTGEMERPARERYSKHVKAVVRAGSEGSKGWETALGFPAEIVPLTDPTALSAGGEIAVRCLVRGKPATNLWVLAGGVADGKPREERGARTDGAGIVRFRLDAPGPWYVKFIHMERASEPDLDYESLWATLAFEVR